MKFILNNYKDYATTSRTIIGTDKYAFDFKYTDPSTVSLMFDYDGNKILTIPRKLDVDISTCYKVMEHANEILMNRVQTQDCVDLDEIMDDAIAEIVKDPTPVKADKFGVRKPIKREATEPKVHEYTYRELAEISQAFSGFLQADAIRRAPKQINTKKTSPEYQGDMYLCTCTEPSNQLHDHPHLGVPMHLKLTVDGLERMLFQAVKSVIPDCTREEAGIAEHGGFITIGRDEYVDRVAKAFTPLTLLLNRYDRRSYYSAEDIMYNRKPIVMHFNTDELENDFLVALADFTQFDYNIQTKEHPEINMYVVTIYSIKLKVKAIK